MCSKSHKIGLWAPMRYKSMRKQFISALASLAMSSSCWSISLEGTAFDAAIEHGVDPYLAYAIALAESGLASDDKKMFGPHPWTARVARNGDLDGGHRFKTEQELKSFVKKYLEEGRSLRGIDVGIMQVNLGYHESLINDMGGWESIVSPAANIRLGSKILSTAMDSTDDPIIGVGRYFSWRKIASKEYGIRVYRYYEALQKLRIKDN